MQLLAVQLSLVHAFASSHEVSLHARPQLGIGMYTQPFAVSTIEGEKEEKRIMRGKEGRKKRKKAEEREKGIPHMSLVHGFWSLQDKAEWPHPLAASQ